ncbi:mechanosensitive ion channel family protein [Geofilum rubicundum]|uniref:Potassium efflux system KefA protein n=1 Tax=Geofilum rubicundum JCM 15548 TaxID=1236989 RepID=A0A0E9LU76_9BACT|nr:mechanosensitive ion channel domain-containing protein [Geofilum rubicundum]GAO28819.1 potassium efflux system KefA protein [Geofilum rubicundum JCM 15548]
MEEITSLLPEKEKLIELTMTYGGRLLLALITLIVGLWLIRKLDKGLSKAFEMRSVDQTLRGFLGKLIGLTLKILLLVSVVSMLGVQMTSFIAILAAAGLAIGMALSGTLQNFAGGVMLLIFKPFKVGDFIDAQGHMGTVKEVQIFHTILNTPDKRTVIIPNGGLSNGSMTNFSTEPIRRLEWTFGISYTDNIDKAREIILGIVSSDERVHKDPAPFVGLINLGDSSVDLVTRVWVYAADYWDLFFEINEKVKKAFDTQGISIPFPQRDVHLFQPKQ